MPRNFFKVVAALCNCHLLYRLDPRYGKEPLHAGNFQFPIREQVVPANNPHPFPVVPRPLQHSVQ